MCTYTGRKKENRRQTRQSSSLKNFETIRQRIIIGTSCFSFFLSFHTFFPFTLCFQYLYHLRICTYLKRGLVAIPRISNSPILLRYISSISGKTRITSILCTSILLHVSKKNNRNLKKILRFAFRRFFDYQSDGVHVSHETIVRSI